MSHSFKAAAIGSRSSASPFPPPTSGHLYGTRRNTRQSASINLATTSSQLARPQASIEAMAEEMASTSAAAGPSQVSTLAKVLKKQPKNETAPGVVAVKKTKLRKSRIPREYRSKRFYKKRPKKVKAQAPQSAEVMMTLEGEIMASTSSAGTNQASTLAIEGLSEVVVKMRQEEQQQLMTEAAKVLASEKPTTSSIPPETRSKRPTKRPKKFSAEFFSLPPNEVTTTTKVAIEEMASTSGTNQPSTSAQANSEIATSMRQPNQQSLKNEAAEALDKVTPPETRSLRTPKRPQIKLPKKTSYVDHPYQAMADIYNTVIQQNCAFEMTEDGVGVKAIFYDPQEEEEEDEED